MVNRDEVLEVNLAELQLLRAYLTRLVTYLQNVHLVTLAHVVLPETHRDFLSSTLQYQVKVGHL